MGRLGRITGGAILLLALAPFLLLSDQRNGLEIWDPIVMKTYTFLMLPYEKSMFSDRISLYSAQFIFIGDIVFIITAIYTFYLLFIASVERARLVFKSNSRMARQALFVTIGTVVLRYFALRMFSGGDLENVVKDLPFEGTINALGIYIFPELFVMMSCLGGAALVALLFAIVCNKYIDVFDLVKR